MKKICILFFAWLSCFITYSQINESYPFNGVRPKNVTALAYTNATIYLDAATVLPNATVVVRNGKIESCGQNSTIPQDAVLIDATGLTIYPSFIDLYSDYGVQKSEAPNERKFGPQVENNRKGAFGWNEAIKSDIRAVERFSHNGDAAKELYSIGIGTVLTHHQDGIARGTGLLTTLGTSEASSVVNADAASFFSFSKGSSRQDYPSSLMGSIALLRQTYYDAQWYAKGGKEQGLNLTLEAMIQYNAIPSVFDASDKWNVIRADKVGDEFNIQYIIKGGGDEYQRLEEIKSSNAPMILPVNFPMAYDVSDPNLSRYIAYAELKHWEMAPYNLMMVYNAKIPFAITAAGLQDKSAFLKNIRTAVKNGLPEKAALEALTTNPAMWMKAQNSLGALKPGYRANFFITSGNIFADETVIYEHVIDGESYFIKSVPSKINYSGVYNFTIGSQVFSGDVTETDDQYKIQLTRIVAAGDTLKYSAECSAVMSSISMILTPDSAHKDLGTWRLSGSVSEQKWFGLVEDKTGQWNNWSALKVSNKTAPADKKQIPPSTKTEEPIGSVVYPFAPYGRTSIPQQKNVLIKNATIWTCEAEGKIEGGQVIISKGKIVAVGKNIGTAGYTDLEIIDGNGMHVTPGIIDEHSHIALMSVNEGSQASSAEVQEASVVWPEDVDIYRQLSGGVTASQLLHGSANPIGGQSALIKLRWGYSADEMLIENADGFIKFALGENVKQANWGDFNTVRFPQTRMGVEQVYYDHFIRAREYGEVWKKYNASSSAKGKKPTVNFVPPRRDLELDALLEILEAKRFITCHSYVQSEINMLMNVADSMRFRVNTFTHILEGYKVADKMKAHGAGASSFSDWWAYKMEVQDAIPYNGALLWSNGITVAFNSDDAEMARRLNQEAAKAVKYGNVPEEEALKFVTLNPAKLLHLDHRMGSIRVGKDADIVLWTAHPLSVYAVAQKTFVDGICMYDKEESEKMEAQMEAERARIIAKMLQSKLRGEPVMTPHMKSKKYFHCDTLGGR